MSMLLKLSCVGHLPYFNHIPLERQWPSGQHSGVESQGLLTFEFEWSSSCWIYFCSTECFKISPMLSIPQLQYH